jgi:hypothetical protein
MHLEPAERSARAAARSRSQLPQCVRAPQQQRVWLSRSILATSASGSSGWSLLLNLPLVGDGPVPPPEAGAQARILPVAARSSGLDCYPLAWTRLVGSCPQAIAWRHNGAEIGHEGHRYGKDVGGLRRVHLLQSGAGRQDQPVVTGQLLGQLNASLGSIQ